MSHDTMNAGRRGFLKTLGGSAFATSALTAQQPEPGSRRIRLGLIGCGGRGNYLAGQVHHLQAEGESVEFVAACDIYQPRLERTAARLGVKPYRRVQDLLADPAVDAVIIATPDRVHVYNALAAVKADKAVYCEKPLTHWQQFDKLKELVRAVRARRAVFQVGAQWVTDPMWTEAGKSIAKGALGKLTHAQAGYFRHGDNGDHGMPIDDPHAAPGPDLDWDAFLADAPKRPFDVSRFFQWRMYLDYSGGPATDLYPHPMTRLFKTLGVGMPKKVVALGGKYFYEGGRDTPDTFDMLIEYPNGMTVAVLGTITNDTGLDTVIRGSEGTLRFSGDSRLVLTPQDESRKPAAAFGKDETAASHLKDFLSCVRTREQPRCDIELAYAVQVPLIMAMLSWKEGKVAVFDAASEEIHLV
jgi:predicted dehydrogenase